MPGRPADVLDVTDFLLDTMVQIQDYWNDMYVGCSPGDTWTALKSR